MIFKKNKLALALTVMSMGLATAAYAEESFAEKAKKAFGLGVDKTVALTKDVTKKVEEVADKAMDKGKELMTDDKEAVLNSLQVMGIQPDDYVIQDKSAIKGAVEVLVKSEGGSIFFFEKGKKLVAGKMFEIKDGKLHDPAISKLFAKMSDFEKEMIVYKADNEKYVVTAFFDVTCHYCKLLHQNTQKYNDLGITIRYLAFPRAGLNDKVAMQMEAIFTSDNPKKAMEDADKGIMPEFLKEPKIVKKHYEYGSEYGITGTPAVIMPSGNVIPGYLEPNALLQYLEDDAKNFGKQ